MILKENYIKFKENNDLENDQNLKILNEKETKFDIIISEKDAEIKRLNKEIND